MLFTLNTYFIEVIILNSYDSLWKPLDTDLSLKHFTKPHIVSLVIIFSIITLMYLFKDTLRKKKYEKRFSKTLAIILITHQITLYYWYINNNLLCLKEALPLYICRISIILCIIMLLSKSHKIFDIIYFWGIGGATIALIFHDNSLYPFPHYMFIQFFISHGGILISALFMIFVHKYTPNLNSIKRTFKWTFIYFGITIPTNYLIDSNYCYLRKLPCFVHFKLLPNTPIFFVPLMIAGLCMFFVLLYLPFYRKAKL